MAKVFALIVAAYGPLATSALTLSAADARVDGPTEKVVSLLSDMKAQVEKDFADDQDAQQKRDCWCETNKKAKDAAVEAAQAKIDDLSAFIEEAAGTEGSLKTEISSLADGIVEDQDSLDQATALRAKENGEFEAEAADSKECISTLGQAVEVLSKVQFVQKDKIHSVLMQLQAKAVALQPPSALGDRFRSVMQQDLWDVMGAMDSTGAPRNFLSALAQPTGAAAGAKSYNSRSGGILGVLSQLKEDFEKSLDSAQQAEAAAVAEFQKLKAAKEGEIASGKAQKAAKEKALADLLAKAAQAKGDITATKRALSADQRFLLELTETCKTNDEEFADRSKMRQDEITALGETISILRADDSRDLFGKTVNFIQTYSVNANAEQNSARNKAMQSAFQRIMKTARKTKNWMLASLAVHVHLDAFEKVKEMMDKMVAELKAQQKAEDEKLAACKKEIDETEDTVKVKGNEKEDLESTKLNLDNSISVLESDIETLNAEVSDMKVSLKQAGEERKESNQVFQQSVSDQRATINILNKALDRLKKFYSPSALVQTQKRQEPGQAISPAPPSAKEYVSSGGAGGVLQLIEKIISEATSGEAEIVTQEQHDQEAYAQLASDMKASIEADNSAIGEKTQQLESAKGEKSETEGGLLANGEELAKLGDMLKGMHLDCDWLMQYFDVRVKARAEEMDAIADAKAILSGANFGSE